MQDIVTFNKWHKDTQPINHMYRAVFIFDNQESYKDKSIK